MRKLTDKHYEDLMDILDAIEFQKIHKVMHHSELRYHTYTQARWDALADSLKPRAVQAIPAPTSPNPVPKTTQQTPYFIPD